MKYILIILILFLPSCLTRKACDRKFPPQTWERTKIDTKEQMRVITLRSTEIILKEGNPVFVDSTGKVNSERSVLDTEFARSEAWVENSVLNHWMKQKAVEKSDTVYITNTVIEREKGEVNEVNVLKWYQTALMWLGAILTILIVIKLIRPFLK